MRFFGRACLSVGFLGTVLVAGGGACIPDPKGEYEDYQERTANLGPKDEPVGDAAVLDTKPPETATEALYVGICTTALALKEGGADVLAWDDNPDSVAKAAGEGIPTEDLRATDWQGFASLVL